MEKIGIAQAKALLPQLLGKLGRGKLDSVVITRSGRPAAKLIPIAAVERKRVGIAKGILTLPDELDAHNKEIARMFNAAARQARKDD